MCDQPVAEAAVLQYTTATYSEHLDPHRDSKPLQICALIRTATGIGYTFG
jgi:hypothetical protein